MSEDLQVAVDLKLVDNFSAIFEGIGKHILETGKHAEELKKKFESIGAGIKMGAAFKEAGSGLLSMLKASTDEAARYEQQLNRLKALNLGGEATRGLEEKALEIAGATKGTSNADALNLVTQTQAMTGNEEQTKMIAPVLAQLRFGMESYMSSHGEGEGEGKGDEAGRQFQAIVKAMEARGLMHDATAEKVDRMADLFARSFVATGGAVQPAEFLEMMQAGGAGARAMSDDFMLAMGGVMHEKGGAGSGAGLMAGYRNLAAGKMPPQVAETLSRLGLLNEEAVHRKDGKITSVDAGGVADSKKLETRPDLYLQENVLPLLEKTFKIDRNDQGAVMRRLSSLSGQDGSSDLFAQLYAEHDQIQSYLAQAKNVAGYKELYKLGGESATGRQADLRTQVGKLEDTFGDAALPVLKSALEQVIPLVKQLGQWMKEHPDGLSMLVKTIAGLGVAMMVVGPMMQLFNVLKLVSMGAGVLAGPLGSVAAAMALRDVGGANGLAAVAGNLRGAGGQLKMLGAAAALFAAYKAGELVGARIYENMSTEHQQSIGGGIARIMALFGSDDAKEALEATKKANAALSPNELSRRAFEDARKRHATMPPPAASNAQQDGKAAASQAAPTVTNHLTVLVDGKEVAAQLIPRTAVGTGDYNSSAQPIRPGMGSHALS